MKKIIKFYIIGLIITCLNWSCTNLEETVYSDILQDNFYKTQEEVVSAIAPVYGNLRGFSNETWDLSTHCTDQTLLPEKALGHWAGANWPLLSNHNWNANMAQFNGAWNFSFGLVNSSNLILDQVEGVSNMDDNLKALLSAEIRMIRGFGYYNLIDLFGNVPLVTSWKVEDVTPQTNSRQEIFNFMVNDLESTVESLSGDVNTATYGRFNKYAGYALLAKYYLNAQVWTGIPQWDKTIEYCDKIIASGKYNLSGNYFDNFLIHNEGSKENIFVIPYDKIYTAWGNFIPWRALHYAQGAVYGMTMVPWNGFTAVPSFIHSFDPEDKRLKGWLFGQQYSLSGDPLLCSQESNGKPLNLTIDYVNIYNPNDGITYGPSYALEFMGARYAKYEYGPMDNTTDNDLVIFRLADIILMKAEALIRKNGGIANSEAVNLVNSVRDRAFSNPAKLYTTSTLTLNALLAERGWEFYGEAMRRNDLVRFGKFVRGTWEFADRSNEPDSHNIFPIPQAQIAANPDLTQNPGY